MATTLVARYELALKWGLVPVIASRDTGSDDGDTAKQSTIPARRYALDPLGERRGVVTAFRQPHRGPLTYLRIEERELESGRLD